MSQFDSLIAECDLYIRSGKPHHVIKRLSGLNLSRVPRAWRLPLAKICRRAGLFPMGLRLLVKLDSDPTPPEQAEYAVLLLRYGAINEALKRLNNINTSDVPEAPLFRAYAHFAKWEYHAAASELERYLQSPLSPSALLLGQTNLAFSYVECRQYDKALTLLADTIRLAKEQNHLHLESYNLAVRAQAYIQQGDYSQARGEIKNARRGSTESLTHDQFFITKIEMIAEGLEHGKLHPFIELKQMAQKKGDWAAVRDADLYSLLVKFDMAQYLHLYFGSPFPEFREHMRTMFKTAPDRDVYVLGPKTAPRFDLITGDLDGQPMENPGGKCVQLLEVMLRDFYESLRVAGLHAALYPDEYFDITTSPDRVRQLIRRTRGWLKERTIPVKILERDGFYSLHIYGPFSFRVPLERKAVNGPELQRKRLKGLLDQGEVLSTHEICEKLNISTSSAHRLLKQAITNGEVVRIGRVKRPAGYKAA